jgi:hypothetical protein
MRLSSGATWVRLATTLLGPVTLAAASVSGISWHTQMILLITGVFLTGVGFIGTERLLRKEVIESILDTAVDFLRSVGVSKVRANLMIVKNDKHILPCYFSSNFRDFEKKHEWVRSDDSCAATALELRAPVIGGMNDELITQDDRPDVTVIEKKPLSNESTRTVLSVPVFYKNGSQQAVIAILNFNDDMGMNKSKLASREVIQAVCKLAPILNR